MKEIIQIFSDFKKYYGLNTSNSKKECDKLILDFELILKSNLDVKGGLFPVSENIYMPMINHLKLYQQN